MCRGPRREPRDIPLHPHSAGEGGARSRIPCYLEAVPAGVAARGRDLCRTTLRRNPDMFIIPVTGLAKAAIVATISLHPAAAHQAHQAPDHYTVKAGDTLSSIARHEYGSATAWPALWWVNRHKVHNPEMIMVGQRLTLSSWHPRKAWLNRAALAAIPAPAPAPASAAAPVAGSTGTWSAPAPSGGVDWSAIAACESGGNWAPTPAMASMAGSSSPRGPGSPTAVAS